MATRSELRRTRYRLLTGLGYSAQDARRLRDQSHLHIEQNITRTERRLARRPAIDRSPEQQRRLRAIRDHKRQLRTEPAETRSRTESKPTRVRNFSEWSRDRNFPPDMLQMVRRINREAGRRPNASYGFRILYHIYVTGETETMSKRRFNRERFERRDT